MLSREMFIEYPGQFDPAYKIIDPAPVFRRNFDVKDGFNKATLEVCGLGIGYYYLNGGIVSEDMFTAPVSDYNKTLWYNTYDVSKQLKVGKNLLAVILGNGFYNESIDTAWQINQVAWRDLPKFALELKIEYDDDTLYIRSDEIWICSDNSPYLFNQLRSGETFDFRISSNWMLPDFDTTNWKNARFSENVPTGVFRKCSCPPIRKFESFSPINIFKNSNNNYIIDFGQNISGFVRVRLCMPEGSSITIRHTERINEDGTCNYNRMSSPPYYKNCDFQTDRLIFSGKLDEWTPLFTYHGFRYIEVEGLEKEPERDAFIAIFVHQDVKPISEFECSDDTLNKLFKMGRVSSFSNMFYSITDCPTREKLGWLNDAQASCEQMLQNYDIYSLFKKWLQDICDTMLDDGQIPGIAPCYGWGYEWGTGPVSSGIIFELPYRMYRYTGKKDAILDAYPYMLKHFEYILSRREEDGLIGYGLIDWSGPFEPEDSAPTPVKFTDTILTIKFARILLFAAKLLGDEKTEKFSKEAEKSLLNSFRDAYVYDDGRCKICEQTAVSLMIVLGVYNNLEPLKKQLCDEVEKYDYHLHCGMLGLQYLFKALNICKVPQYGYRILTADGHPSPKEWIVDGGTSLYERWSNKDSNNHHMFSCFLAWMNMTFAGIKLDKNIPGFKKAIISPWFIPELDYCKAIYNTASGLYAINWSRKQDGTIELNISIPKGATAELILNGRQFNDNSSCVELESGNHSFICY